MVALSDTRQREHAAADPRPARRATALWLFGTALLVLLMAVIGAITRLTESGLSIMEWAPVAGALPPLSEAEWQRLFALYRTIPEYRLENAGMTIGEFKEIFWWEWLHRFWGRMIGLAYFLPFLWLLLTRRLDRCLARHGWILLGLGALQGALGWFMVASGFAERSDVSQYRLVAHLFLAALIYAYLVWLGLGVLEPRPERASGSAFGRLLRALIALAALTLVSGGLVAGTNAGFTYNTFPLMDGRLVPSGYGALQPFLLNLTETIEAIQFNHRLLALATLAAALAIWFSGRRRPAPLRRALDLLALAALAQVALGIAALLLVVPVWLGALHQAGAFVLLTAAFFALHRERREAGHGA